MDGKALTVLNPGSLVEIFSDYGCLKHKKIRISYRVVQNFLAAEVKLNTRRKIETDLGNGMFSQLRTKIDK